MRTFGRRGGALPALFVLALLAAPGFGNAQTLKIPAGWTHRDIGTPAIAGSADITTASVVVRGAGTDIAGTSDQFHFAYAPLAGDVDVRARVSGLQPVNSRGKVGVMIRESVAVDSRHGFIYVSGDGSTGFQFRNAANRKTSLAAGPSAAIATWLRLVRKGSTFTAYSSTDGTTWTTIGTASIPMTATPLVGLAVTSRDAKTLATTTFGAFTATVPMTLPAPWVSTDIGAPALAGVAGESGGTFTVKGAGQDIWDVADQQQFVYQPITGDTQLIAYVASLQAPDTWSKAGLMIRESLTAGAANAAMVATGGNGWEFQRRLFAGGISYMTNGSAGAAPGWVRLVREGNLFSAYQSQDGTQWTLVGTDTITMPATVYVGMAVTSHSAAALATATLSNISISLPTPANKPPTVSLSSPVGGTSFVAPANILISATAGDADGTVSRVDFYSAGQLIGSATASPFALTWTGVPVGTYTLTAMATDNSGATAVSAPVTVTVTAPPVSVPTKVVFVPSTDYDLQVTSCTVELRRATDATSAVPVASGNIGKPVAVNGEITVDVSTLVDPLAAGSYYAVVVSNGPGGSTPSAPSATFVK